MFICAIVHFPDGTSKRIQCKSDNRTLLHIKFVTECLKQIRKYAKPENKLEILTDDIPTLAFLQKNGLSAYFKETPE